LSIVKHILPALSAAVPLIGAALYSGLVVSRYALDTGKLTRPIKIVLLTDLHSTRHGKRQRKLIQKIEAECPDLIMMSGDMLDEHRSFAPLAELLRRVVNIAPVFYVSGNHEYRIANIGYFFSQIKKLGVNILHDEHQIITVRGQRILIAGADDAELARLIPGYKQSTAMKNAFSHLKDDHMLKILLAHRPERFARYARYPFDVTLCGHAHGGHMRIPFLDVGVVAHTGLFPKYTSGVHCIGKCCMVISRGLSVFPLMPRIYNPPEVVSITLR
jgi:predicted MPP superfamily phosphohydrolase